MEPLTLNWSQGQLFTFSFACSVSKIICNVILVVVFPVMVKIVVAFGYDRKNLYCRKHLLLLEKLQSGF